MKRLAVQISIAVFLCVGASGQKKVAVVPSLTRPYWLNYSLVFLEGCRPVVSPHNITFTDGNCPESNAYSGKIFLRATKVKIYSVAKGKGFTKIKFRHWPEIYELDSEYEVLLRSDSERNFSNSFHLLFSEREVTDERGATCPDDLKTKAQVIKCMGFPISISKVGGVEKYSYILEFVGFGYLGYDGWTFEIKNNKVINVSGYI